jgi:hypothetical protein
MERLLRKPFFIKKRNSFFIKNSKKKLDGAKYFYYKWLSIVNIGVWLRGRALP